MDVQVAIVGGGFAGACAAHVLARQGFSVALIDRQRFYPDLFRAEKLEPDQAALMRRLGLLDLRVPRRGPIGTTLNFDGRETTPFDTVEQYGISYADTVNSLLQLLPETVCRVFGRVAGIDRTAAGARVLIEAGRSVSANLVVLAAGGNEKLLASAGLVRRWERSLKSLSFGFDIARVDGAPWTFNGFNYHLRPNAARADYVTVFPIGDRMRVNLFTQLDPRHKLVAAFKADPTGMFEHWFPGIQERIGPFALSSPVQVVPTVFYRLKNPARAGLVAIGDEYQSVSPATGMGLSKVLNDVEALCIRHAPGWLGSGCVTRTAVRAFYADPEKAAADHRALDAWRYYHDRQLGGRVSLATRVKRKLVM